MYHQLKFLQSLKFAMEMNYLSLSLLIIKLSFFVIPFHCFSFYYWIFKLLILICFAKLSLDLF